jgi:hypothetical protein
MKLKSNIDYGMAFDIIKQGLLSSEETRKGDGEGLERYMTAYSKLAAFAEAAIDYVEDKTEGETLPINPPTEQS